MLESENNHFENIMQVGIVVEDIQKTCSNLETIFGIGSWEIVDWPPRERMKRWYRNSPADFTAKMAFCQVGNVELEIIQPLSGKSIWRDFLDEKGEGIHHIRFNVDDHKVVEDRLQKDFGIQSIQHGDGIRPGTVWMNFGSEKAVGFIIEIMRMVPGTDGLTPK